MPGLRALSGNPALLETIKNSGQDAQAGAKRSVYFNGHLVSAGKEGKTIEHVEFFGIELIEVQL